MGSEPWVIIKIAPMPNAIKSAINGVIQERTYFTINTPGFSSKTQIYPSEFLCQPRLNAPLIASKRRPQSAFEISASGLKSSPA